MQQFSLAQPYVGSYYPQQMRYMSVSPNPPISPYPFIQAPRRLVIQNRGYIVLNVSPQSSYTAAFPRNTVYQPVQLPDEETIKARLSRTHSLGVGLKNGFIFGVLSCVPIYVMERLFQLPNALSQVVTIQQGGPSAEKIAETLRRPAINAAASLGGSVVIGTILGGILGWTLIGHTRKKLLEIQRVKHEQQQGIFQAKKPSLFASLGLAEKPITNPDQALKEVLQKDLDPDQAFWQGVKIVLLLKIIKGICLPFTFLGGLLGIAKISGSKQLEEIVISSVKPTLKMMIQPLFLAKMALAPIIGGMIAKQTVPWLREQLGISKGR